MWPFCNDTLQRVSFKIIEKNKINYIYIYIKVIEKNTETIYIYKGDRKKNGNNKSFKIDINIASP